MRKSYLYDLTETKITDRSQITNLIQIIKSIQQAEGNFNCFGTAMNGCCDHGSCLWKADCLNATGGPFVIN